MTTLTSLVVAVLAVVVVAAPAVAQSLVGALAIDERQGDQWGWAVDYETAVAAQGMALQECGPGCSVVLTFDRSAVYAADQEADSTAEGWAESYDSATGARQAALAECLSRGGSGCMVRVWGCNSPVVEEDLGLNRATRRQMPVEPAVGRLRRWGRGRSVRSADALWSRRATPRRNTSARSADCCVVFVLNPLCRLGAGWSVVPNGRAVRN